MKRYERIYRDLALKAEAQGLRPRLEHLELMGVKEEGRRWILGQHLLKRIPVGDKDKCWIWTGTTHPNGYGEVRDSPISRKAHRLAYALLVGPVPQHLGALHKCDNPPCVNPNHLFLGTQKDNMADCMAKGRQDYTLRRGEFNPQSKITKEIIVKARELRLTGMSFPKIAISLNAPYWAIYEHFRGRSWQHI